MSTAAPTLAAAVELYADGGVAPNIVPANTSALYYLRAPDVESLQQRETRVRACFEAGGLATGCAHEVTQTWQRVPGTAGDPSDHRDRLWRRGELPT
ncbi:MAG: hypothetical protein ACRDSF_13380 [Pseudonocardiaceae bacterium]